MLDFSHLSPGLVTASLVVNEEGFAWSRAGNSKGLGNETDFQLLKWFRARAEIVLTSGLTADLENYRLPSMPKLAILSNSKRYYPNLDQHKDEIVWLTEMNYLDAVQELRSRGFHSVHTEFGPSGFTALANSVDVHAFLSSISPQGLHIFANEHDLNIEVVAELKDLVIARVSGRGKA